MMRLKSKLLSLNADKTLKTKIFSPANTEELRIPFKVDKTAKVVGKLAQIPPPNALDQDEQLITGVLVQNDFKMSLMAPEDLREYAGLTTTTIVCKQRITLSAAGIDLIKWALEGTFGAIEEIGTRNKTIGAEANGNGVGSGEEAGVEEIDHSPHPTSYLVMGCVTVRHQNSGAVEIEWEGNMLNDGIADAILAVLFTVESSPAAVKRRNAHSILRNLLTRFKNLQKCTLTATTITVNGTLMQTSLPRSAFHACACSSKPSSVLKSPPSPVPSSQRHSHTWPQTTTRSKKKQATSSTWTKRRRSGQISRRKNWNDCTALAYRSRGLRSRWISTWPRCGWRLWRLSARTGC